MARNTEIEAAWRYHDLTKHSYRSVHAFANYLDWANQPSPFKIYPNLEPIPLPRDLIVTGKPALEAIVSSSAQHNQPAMPTLDQLAAILFYSAGITKEKVYPGGKFYFRAAACAGALYPTEIYVVCSDIQGLEAGVYHFNAGDFALRQLRRGDYRNVVVEASASDAHIAHAPVILIATSISWRSTWKYSDRAYRYHYWDNGMITANALALAWAHGLPAQLVMGFVEAEINKLVGVDGNRELALSLLALGHVESFAPPSSIDELPDLKLDVIPISRSQVDYPSIPEMHAASSFTNRDEVAEWRKATVQHPTPEATGKLVSLPQPQQDLPGLTIEDVIARRASTGRFARKPIKLSDLSIIVDRARQAIPADFLQDSQAHINDLYLIVNSVEDLAPGAYYYRRDHHVLESLKEGDFRSRAAYLVLDQNQGGDASVTIFFMTDLNRLLASHGNRGYRAAQMEAGMHGGRIYIAAYALKRGATGLTFYDDDVTDFFSPHSAGKSCIFVMSVGVPGKRLMF